VGKASLWPPSTCRACSPGPSASTASCWATSSTREITVSSPLALLDPPQLAFYARHGASFRALRAAPSHGLTAPLADVELAEDGTVVRVQFEGGA
jgi:hypothetical protein